MTAWPVTSFVSERGFQTVLEISDRDLDRLLEEAELYNRDDPHYDDVFNDTGRRLRSQAFATKEDVAILAFWKAINLAVPWAKDFLRADPRVVHGATQQAFREGVEDADRLAALEHLPGFRSWRDPTGGAIPSTLLCCWNPHDYAVTDIRVREALLDLTGYQVRGLLDYWDAVRIIRRAAARLRPSVTARDIDKGLFRLAGDKKRI